MSRWISDCDRVNDLAQTASSGRQELGRRLQQLHTDLGAPLYAATHVHASPPPRRRPSHYLAPGVIDGPHRPAKARAARLLAALALALKGLLQ